MTGPLPDAPQPHQQESEGLARRTITEIFVKLARIEGKLDGYRDLAARVSSLEGKLQDMKVEDAELRGKRQVTRHIIDTIIGIGIAIVGAGVYFKGYFQ